MSVRVFESRYSDKKNPSPPHAEVAVKSSFLESVPEVAAKLKEPNTKDMKFADVVEQTKEAAALVLVY
jgi:hypothetical protein